MTVSTTTSRVAYTGDGVTVAFAVPFPFFDTSDLVVIERNIVTGAETIKVLSTHYTVAGGAQGGVAATGTVTALSAPANTVQWIIIRALPFTQLIDYVSNDGFPAESHEAGLDRGAMRDQELRTSLARTLRLPVTDPDGLIVELPPVPVRAGKVLGFDANGSLIVVVDIPAGSINLPLPVADGGTGATNVAGARTALGAAGLADANVFVADQVIEKTDPGASEGPLLVLRRISSTPAASDKIGGIAMDGKDGAGNTQRFAQIHAELVDPANSSEDSRLEFFTIVGGAYTSGMRLGAGLQLGVPTGGDPGAGWLNAQGGLKVNNVELIGVAAGAVVNRVYAQTVTFSSITAIIPFDDTKPQLGEGTQVLTASITPKAAANKILVTVTLEVGSNDAQDAVVAALFKDSDADALAAASFLPVESRAGTGTLVMNFEMTAGGTSPIAFKVRMGPGSTGNAYLNGNDGARVLGGALVSSIVLTEVKV
ncbi:MAG: hypothetical protein WD044_00055 [Dongiaceae bacterium]